MYRNLDFFIRLVFIKKIIFSQIFFRIQKTSLQWFRQKIFLFYTNTLNKFEIKKNFAKFNSALLANCIKIQAFIYFLYMFGLIKNKIASQTNFKI